MAPAPRDALDGCANVIVRGHDVRSRDLQTEDFLIARVDVDWRALSGSGRSVNAVATLGEENLLGFAEAVGSRPYETTLPRTTFA